MVTLSIDTSQIVDLVRQRDKAALAVFDAVVLSPTVLIVSTLVRFELTSGVHQSAAPARRAAQLDALLDQCLVADFKNEDAAAAGRVDADLRRRGRPIGDIDTLIAGQALARGWTVVTRNVRHFGRVDGLPIIDWSAGPDPLSAEVIAARVAEGLEA